MKNKSLLRIFFLFGSLSLMCASYSQTTVYLESGEFGRGILKPRNGECFSITPLHVVESSEGMPFELVGDGGITSKAVLAKSYAGDIALVRILEGGTQRCKDFTIKFDFEGFIQNLTTGVLELRNVDGSAEKILVDITNVGDYNITITPQDHSQSFGKGMSGGSLFSLGSEKVFLGLLLSIDDDNNKIGYVFQADDIDRILSDFFGSGVIDYNSQTDKEKSQPQKAISSEELKKLITEARHKVTEDEVFTQTIFSELREDSRYLATIKLKLGLQESALYYAELPKNLRIQDSGLVKKINEVSKGFDKAYKISVSDSRTFEQDLLAQITTLNYQLNDLQMKL